MHDKIGMSLWTIYGWNPQETVSAGMLERIAAMGCQAVELVVDEAYNTEELLMKHRSDLQEALQATGLEVPSVASALFWRYNLASQGAAVRKRGVNIVEQQSRVASAFGAHAILIVAGLQEPCTEYARTYETAVHTVREAARYAKECGVTVGVEHVPCSFLTTPREYAQFLADVDHPFVKAYVDVGNAAGTCGGFAENWISAVHGRIAMAHVKDYGAKAGFTLCGQGELNWNNALGALWNAGYRDALIIETPPDNGKRGQDIPAGLEAARISFAWLEAFLQSPGRQDPSGRVPA